MTVYYLNSGLKKLRQVEASKDRAAYMRWKFLYRGMKDMTLDADKFATFGGTELVANPRFFRAAFAVRRKVLTRMLLLLLLLPGVYVNDRGQGCGGQVRDQPVPSLLSVSSPPSAGPQTLRALCCHGLQGPVLSLASSALSLLHASIAAP